MLKFIRATKLFRRAAWIAVLAVLLPVVVPLFHHPAQPAAHVLRICSSSKPAPNDPAGKLPSCPVCQSLHQFGHGFVPPDSISVIPVARIAAATLRPAQDAFLQSMLRCAAWPRAPPSLA